MFSDIDSNIEMLKGAYRKLKSYYYYNKNFILMRKKISEFESDHSEMEKSFANMAEVLFDPNTSKSKKYLSNLMNNIDFYVLPKKFVAEDIDNPNKPVSNTIQRDKRLETVNFFINADIDVYIFDTLWTILAAKMDKDNHLLSYNVYGNTINMTALFPTDTSIKFDSITLFNRYFSKYTSWRNNAFDALEKNYNRNSDSILISLDIKSYYYSVAFDFDKLPEYFDNHPNIQLMIPITDIIRNVYSCYYNRIVKYRKDLNFLKNKETPLPIGLFSSMFLGNIYLRKLDDQFTTIDGVSYYGRYVDDILLVIKKSVSKEFTNENILNMVLVDNGIAKLDDKYYSFIDYPSLKIQSDKIKIIYIDHNESRAIIDIYNNTIRLIPSQMDSDPIDSINLPSFDETAYNIDKLNKEHKIRDIGFGEIDSFKVGRYFSALPYKYARINIGGNKLEKEINKHIDQVTKFFSGSQCIEFHIHWLNYMYFLVITQRNRQLRDFYTKTKERINSIQQYLDGSMYRWRRSIIHNAKQTLLQHHKICLETALALDIDTVNNHFSHYKNDIQKILNSNMFEHNFVALPLANYLKYKTQVPYCKMSFSQLGVYPRPIEEDFKFIWSPRFIHYDELLLLLFFDYHRNNRMSRMNRRNHSSIYKQELLVERYAKINHIDGKPFYIESEIINTKNYDEYILKRINVPTGSFIIPDKVNIAVGSIEITEEKCIASLERWKNITFEEKELLYNILSQSYNCFKSQKSKNSGPKLLVFPELYFPIYWIRDLMHFSRSHQIGIVTGLQYLEDNKHVYNYLATILPFESGKKHYRNAFLHIREKNDYSPREFEELAKKGLLCQNREIATYQIFYWNGIRLAPVECFELTDIMVRALLKGRCDLIAAPVFNSDTTYFSNIIDSTARDLHAFIVQANTSHLGDSRVTGPYDRDSKDIYKIKGGDNDHVVIGTIEFKKLKDYQDNYNNDLEKKCKRLLKNPKSQNKKDKSKPDIKPLPARFKNK